MKSMNTLITKLLKCNLAHVRKSFKRYIIPLSQLSYIYWHLHFKENIAFVKLFEIFFGSNTLDSYLTHWYFWFRLSVNFWNLHLRQLVT